MICTTKLWLRVMTFVIDSLYSLNNKEVIGKRLSKFTKMTYIRIIIIYITNELTAHIYKTKKKTKRNTRIEMCLRLSQIDDMHVPTVHPPPNKKIDGKSHSRTIVCTMSVRTMIFN